MMNKIKIVMITVLCSMFFGCGNANEDLRNETNESRTETVSESVSEVERSDEVVSLDTTMEPELTEESLPDTSESEEIKGEIKILSAKEMVSEMKVGWNLGNTMDSEGKLETSWGNPKTTKEMIDTVAAAGFNTIRIPTTWYCRADSEGNIDKEWLKRVAEVIDYLKAKGIEE